MKVLIDGLSLQQSLGVRRYTNSLIESYIRRYGKGNVMVIIPEVTGEEFYNYILYKNKYRFFINFFVFHRFVRKLDFDIFHAPANTSHCFKIKGKFYVTTMHDIMYKVVPSFYSSNCIINFLKIRLLDLYTYFTLKNSDLVISISETTKNDLLEHFKTDSVIIPNGIVKLPESKKDEKDCLRNYGLTPKSYFLYVGSDKRHKNVDFLIKSFLAAKTDKKLVLCGFRRNGYTNYKGRISFTGHITDSELAQLYMNTEAFVFPSLYEGFGLPVLEALQYGVKVFSSNGGALKEFPSEVVSFFDPTNENELISLLENPGEYELDINIINDFLQQYSWDKLLDRLQDIVEASYKKHRVIQ